MNWWQMVCVTMFPSDCRCGTSMELSATSIKMMNISHADDEENWQSALRNLWDESLLRTSSVNEMNDERWIPLWCELTQFSKWFHDLPFNINHDDFFKECCPLLLHVKGHCDQLSIQLLAQPIKLLLILITCTNTDQFKQLFCLWIVRWCFCPLTKKPCSSPSLLKSLVCFPLQKQCCTILPLCHFSPWMEEKFAPLLVNSQLGCFLQVSQSSSSSVGWTISPVLWALHKKIMAIMQILFSPFMLSFPEQLVLDATLWESFRLPARMPFMTRRDVWNFAFKSWRIVEKKWNKLKFMLFVVQDFLCKKTETQKQSSSDFWEWQDDSTTVHISDSSSCLDFVPCTKTSNHQNSWSAALSCQFPSQHGDLCEVATTQWILLEFFLLVLCHQPCTSVQELLIETWVNDNRQVKECNCVLENVFLATESIKISTWKSSWSIWTSSFSKFYLWPMEFSQTVSSHCQTHLVGSPCHLQVTAIWMQSFSHRKQIWHHWHFGEWINQELQHSSSFPPNPKHSKLT